MIRFLTEFSLPAFLAIITIIMSQSIILFIDARKRKANAWFWGIWGATTFPLPTILYLIFVRKVFKKNKSR